MKDQICADCGVSVAPYLNKCSECVERYLGSLPKSELTALVDDSESLRALVKELVERAEAGTEDLHRWHGCTWDNKTKSRMPEGTCNCGLLQLIARARAALGEG